MYVDEKVFRRQWKTRLVEGARVSAATLISNSGRNRATKPSFARLGIWLN